MVLLSFQRVACAAAEGGSVTVTPEGANLGFHFHFLITPMEIP